MNTSREKNDNNVLLFSGILSLILFGFACSFPFMVSESDTQTTAIPPLSTQEPDLQVVSTPAPINLAGPPPELGDTLRWVDGSLVIYIPPGEFVMGYGGEDNPEHTVYLDGFWIYSTEVTNRMYWRCMAMGECPPPVTDLSLLDLESPGVANYPVVDIPWELAESYCEFIGGHLPTEAQWEKTARGPQGNLYPWGDGAPTCDLLNFNECLGKTSPVVDYPSGASFYEVLDMAGNVFEWVLDWYQADYYEEAHFDNPWGPELGEVRSVRGSGFNTGLDQTASALRYFLEPEKHRSDLGFRCVVDNAHEFAPPCEILAHEPPGLAGNPGTGPGGSASCVVPQPEINVITYCEGGRRGNNISWTPSDAAIDYVTADGVSCAQYDADTLACSGSPGGSVTIEACKSCPPPVVQLGVPGACDPPYILDAPSGLCRYSGGSLPGAEQCTPGHSLLSLPDAVCCQMQAGSPRDYPTCPPGGHYEAASNICWFTLPSTGDEKCASKTVSFESCRRPGSSSSGSNDDCPPEYVYCYYFGNQQVCVCTAP